MESVPKENKRDTTRAITDKAENKRPDNTPALKSVLASSSFSGITNAYSNRKQKITDKGEAIAINVPKSAISAVLYCLAKRKEKSKGMSWAKAEPPASKEILFM
jgi:hypothetical protein